MFAGSRSFPLNTRHTPNMAETEADKLMGLFFLRLAALQIFLATSTVKTNNYVIIPEDEAKLNDQPSYLRGWNPGLAGFN